MKSLKLTVVAISLVGIFGVGNAMAADLTVLAEVVAACEVVTAGELDFLTLDALTAPVVTMVAGTPPTIRCTNGTTYTVSDDASTNPLAHTGTSGDTIAYTLAYPSPPVADGTAQGLPITGTIASGTYVGKAAGDYLAEVTLTITPTTP